mmetsp:Transcript_28836/g.69032  ORF Transcript_28836/g.69032 Transcript_28836/m.69032 type:complete len:239 (-) Transcript_28836:996-1712(-)
MSARLHSHRALQTRRALIWRGRSTARAKPGSRAMGSRARTRTSVRALRAVPRPSVRTFRGASSANATRGGWGAGSSVWTSTSVQQAWRRVTRRMGCAPTRTARLSAHARQAGQQPTLATLPARRQMARTRLATTRTSAHMGRMTATRTLCARTLPGGFRARARQASSGMGWSAGSCAQRTRGKHATCLRSAMTGSACVTRGSTGVGTARTGAAERLGQFVSRSEFPGSRQRISAPRES